MKHCFKITVVFGFLLTALVSCTSSSQKPILGYGTVVPFEFDYNYYTYGKDKTIKSKYYEVQEKFGELILSYVYEA